MKNKNINYFFICSLISTLYAGYDTDYMNEDNDPSCVQRNSMGLITPPVNPVVKHGIDSFVFGDFIYWTPRIDNLLYKQTGILSSSEKDQILVGKKKIIELVIPPETSSSSSVDHKLSPGFKAGIGVNFMHDGWDSLIRYTWLHSQASEVSASKNFSYGHELAFSKFVEFNSSTTTINHSSSSWNLRFNTADWEFGRAFYISPKLILRPYLGLKGTWQHQYYSVNMTDLIDKKYNLDTLDVKSTTTGSYSIYNKQSFWGVGIRPGFNSSWGITDHCSIFGETSFSALWGYFDTTRNDTAVQNSTDEKIASFSNLTVTNTNQRNHTICPVLEFLIGLRWEVMCSNDDYRIRLQAGWEEQVWFNQNQFININGFNPYGNLNLQGLTLEMRIDF
jgi:hypothetical protein